MRSVAALALLVASAACAASATACGASPAATTVPASRPVVDSLDGGAGNAAVDPLPSLDALADRGPTDAPLMREALRVEHAAPRSADVRADRDLCLRASFAANAPVRAWFADGTGAARGETTVAASGTVPPRGPVCAKKGEALHLVVESTAADDGRSPAATARAVIFAAP